MRSKIIEWSIVLIFLFLVCALSNLDLLHGRKYRELSDKNCIRLLTQEGARGKIFDRRGEVIVDNRLSYDIMILPQEKKQVEDTLIALSEALHVNAKDLRERYRRGYLAPFIPVCVVKNADAKQVIWAGVLRSEYNNIVIQPKPLRFYPHGRLACHVIGYLNEIDHWRLTKLENYGYKTKDIVGFGGIEEKFDYYLRQNEGALSVEVDHKGKFMRVLGLKPPLGGKDIQLTIDNEIQNIVEQVLGERKGSVIIMNPSSGEIIAMASAPGFDPSLFVTKPAEAMTNLSESALLNRAISATYAPGSVFKLVSAIAGLEMKKINLLTTFYCPGGIRIGNRQFNCWDIHHDENLHDAIAHSCDVFFYRVGMMVGPQALHDYALKFGLAKITGIELPYEIGGFIPDPLWKRISRMQGWFDGDTANFAIGQGDVLVTPLQIARLVASYANRGILVTPHIVKNIGGKEVSGVAKKRIVLSFKQSFIEYIRNDMRAVVSDPAGTANVLAELPVSVAGKTGTAQAGGNKTHGWFTGFFPFENPKFAICVFIENNGSGHAASVLAKQIIEGMIKSNKLEGA